MSERIPGYPDPSFNSEESEAYAPSEDAAEVPEALAASSRRFSGSQDSGSATSETPSSGAGRRPNIRQSSPRGSNARAASGAARSAPRTVAPGYRPRLARRLFAAGGCALFSILVAWVAVFTVTGQAIDTLSMEAAMRWAEPLGAVGSTVTHIISVPAMVAVGGLIVLIAWLRRRPTLAGRALGMIVAANTTTQVAKLLIDRPDFHVSAAILNSLPSGHTTVAMSLALALVMIAPPRRCSCCYGNLRFLGTDLVSARDTRSPRRARPESYGCHCNGQCAHHGFGSCLFCVGTHSQ